MVCVICHSGLRQPRSPASARLGVRDAAPSMRMLHLHRRAPRSWWHPPPGSRRADGPIAAQTGCRLLSKTRATASCRDRRLPDVQGRCERERKGHRLHKFKIHHMPWKLSMQDGGCPCSSQTAMCSSPRHRRLGPPMLGPQDRLPAISLRVAGCLRRRGTGVSDCLSTSHLRPRQDSNLRRTVTRLAEGCGVQCEPPFSPCDVVLLRRAAMALDTSEAGSPWSDGGRGTAQRGAHGGWTAHPQRRNPAGVDRSRCTRRCAGEARVAPLFECWRGVPSRPS